jgi:hypothetical protein
MKMVNAEPESERLVTLRKENRWIDGSGAAMSPISPFPGFSDGPLNL